MIAIGSVLATACTSFFEDNPEPGNSMPEQGAIYFTLDEQIAEIGNEIEGFAGYYFNEDGSIEILIKEEFYDEHISKSTDHMLEKISRIDSKIVSELKAKTGRTNITYRKADFSFKELNSWRNHIRKKALSIEGISMLDIDETRNRITIGMVPSAIDSAKIFHFLATLNIPKKAIEIVQREIPELISQSMDECIQPFPVEERQPPDCEFPEPVGGGSGGGGGSNIRLNGTFSTYVGGIQVANGVGKACTLGLNVSWSNDSRKGFVTASHCTEMMAELDRGDFYQYSMNFAHVGEEVVDRAAFDRFHDGIVSCPEEHDDQEVVCRYSDAALVEYSSSSFAKGELGYIAMPVSLNSNYLAGPSDIYGYELMDVASWPYKNMNVHMVGKNSGLQTGKVTRSCTDTFSSDELTGQLYYFICVAEADYDSEEGDSGAPVITNSYTDWDYDYYDFEVMLVGFHIGAAGHDYVYFSGAYYTVGNVTSSGGRCYYANYNGGDWLNTELCNEPSGYGPFEIRAIGNR